MGMKVLIAFDGKNYQSLKNQRWHFVHFTLKFSLFLRIKCNSHQLKKLSLCPPGGAVTLLTVQRGSLGLVNVKSRHFVVVQTMVPDPVALTSDVAHGVFFWADNMGNIYSSDGQQISTLYSGKLQQFLYQLEMYCYSVILCN